ncbi:MAG: hypothetical protein JXB19_11820 [Bacteroidales bacterium]|nr:hypothetical protein [Bacteroidales bacterium]
MLIPDRSKISSVTILVFFALAIGFTLFFYLGNVQPGTEGTPVEEPMVTDEVIILSYIYFGIALFLALIFFVFEILRNPKSAKSILIGFVVFVAIFGLGYLMATGNPIPGFNNPSNVKPTIKLVDAGLKAAYIFIGLAVTGVIYTEISGMLKSN